LKHLLQLVNGFLIGVANIIPGVSGGTFALVLGIFDRLVNSLKSFDVQTIKVVFGLFTGGFSKSSRQRLIDEFRRTDSGFLILLGIGAIAAIVACSRLFGEILLPNYPGETLAFFVGLIIPSLAVPYRMMEKKGPQQLFWIIPGAALTVLVSLSDISSHGENPNILIVMLGGVLAVSAMIMPGVSGSFCLLILGLYQPTTEHINRLTSDPNIESITFIGAMAAGIGIGFIAFTRIMSFLLNRFRSATLAFLIGLILGSFWVLWPIKEYHADLNPEMKQKIQIATAPNRLPGEEGDLVLCGKLAIAGLLGLAGAIGVNRIGKRNENMKAV